jgi:hypothetical protein
MGRWERTEIGVVQLEAKKLQPSGVAHTGSHPTKDDEAGYLWLTPVILATWEAEIRRIKLEASLNK